MGTTYLSEDFLDAFALCNYHATQVPAAESNDKGWQVTRILLKVAFRVSKDNYDGFRDAVPIERKVETLKLTETR